ncbi:ribose-5-phosphate isomerase RpiA [Thalassobacter stenotrophicus]|uniref:ribose-5-phosphate isomerase RpiA n=1 Tax=Thalassobacter stenotrophicus TaxID=266809 RepID=UPI0022A99FD6|nr:ribose-5-phosphate isomerase RpiA [Thalassobacter stenotrophicus]UYP66873.1 ribose-5-phosphate isomerase RpiA [Thalassobacter stenotrophicus]
MSADLNPIEKAKYVSARRAVDYVEDGMRVGLGTGSTAAWMVRCLAEMVRNDGLNITGVATSTRTAELATSLGIKVVDLNEAKWLDVTIDGADEFDDNLTLIKGGGGALLQEKIVATASDKMVVITDPTKHVKMLGAFPLPVEVIPFGWQTTQSLIEKALVDLDVDGRNITLRLNQDAPFRTDEGNLILDLHLERLEDAQRVSHVLNQIPGVVENGLFINLCDVVIVGAADGSAIVRDINNGTVTNEQVAVNESDSIFTDVGG